AGPARPVRRRPDGSGRLTDRLTLGAGGLLGRRAGHLAGSVGERAGLVARTLRRVADPVAGSFGGLGRLVASVVDLGPARVHEPIPSLTDLFEALAARLRAGDVGASRRHAQHRDPTHPVLARPPLL